MFRQLAVREDREDGILNLGFDWCDLLKSENEQVHVQTSSRQPNYQVILSLLIQKALRSHQ